MEAVREGTRSRSDCPVARPLASLSFFLIFFLFTFMAPGAGLALQSTAEQPQHEQGPAGHEKPAVPEKELQQPTPAPSHQESAPPKAQPHGPEAQTHGPSDHGEAQGRAHGGEHGEGHVELPEISPVPGITFVDTIIKLMDHELHGRFLGWRPNGIFIARLTDNVNNYQLGVLEAVRFTAIRLKDSLTRLGEADSYDPDLEQVLNDLYINPASWWFPAADGSYDQALEHLRKFKSKLEKGQRNFYYRRDTLVALLSSYRDQIGNVNRTLVMPVGWWKSDDYFYYAKGVAHVYYEILKVCRVGFKNQLATMHGTDIMDEVLHELHNAENINPWIIFDSDLDGFFANHRANLNAPLSEVAHLLVVLSQL
jgi:hypothetical protein